jgi:hypothetical protein
VFYCLHGELAKSSGTDEMKQKLSL